MGETAYPEPEYNAEAEDVGFPPEAYERLFKPDETGSEQLHAWAFQDWGTSLVIARAVALYVAENRVSPEEVRSAFEQIGQALARYVDQSGIPAQGLSFENARIELASIEADLEQRAELNAAKIIDVIIKILTGAGNPPPKSK